MRALYLAIVSASLCIGLAGCSQQKFETPDDSLGAFGQAKSPANTATASSSSHRAVDLLTDADVREISGKTLVRSGVTSGGSYMNSAEFELNDGDVAYASIVLGVMNSGGRTYFDKCLTQRGITPVSGLGDGAISTETDHIIAVQGDTLIEVQWVGIAHAGEGVVNRLADRIFTRLR